MMMRDWENTAREGESLLFLQRTQQFPGCMTWGKFLSFSKDQFSHLSDGKTCDAESVQFSSVTQSCPTLWDPMNCSIPGLPVHHQLPESTQTHVHRVVDAIQPYHPLLFPSPPVPNPSQHQSLFQRVNSSHEVAKVLGFQLMISTSKEIPGLISFRMDWLDLLAVQGTLKSLLQHHSSKASILRCSAFFTVELTSIRDHWKNHSLD